MRLAPWLVVSVAIAVLFSAQAAHASDSIPVTPHASAHDAQVSHGELTWHSVYIDNTAPFDGSSNKAALMLDLARPIKGTLDIAASPGVTPVVDNGAIESLVIDPRRLPSWAGAIHVTIHAPFQPGDAVLEPPLTRGETTARVVVSGDDGLRFEPSEPAVERHVGYAAPPASRESDRQACDARIGSLDPLPLDDVPLYLTGADVVHGVRGEFSTGPDRARAGVFVATILFVFIAILLALAHKRLSGRARIEQAEAVLREEYGGDWRNQ